MENENKNVLNKLAKSTRYTADKLKRVAGIFGVVVSATVLAACGGNANDEQVETQAPIVDVIDDSSQTETQNPEETGGETGEETGGETGEETGGETGEETGGETDEEVVTEVTGEVLNEVYEEGTLLQVESTEDTYVSLYSNETGTTMVLQDVATGQEFRMDFLDSANIEFTEFSTDKIVTLTSGDKQIEVGVNAIALVSGDDSLANYVEDVEAYTEALGAMESSSNLNSAEEFFLGNTIKSVEIIDNKMVETEVDVVLDLIGDTDADISNYSVITTLTESHILGDYSNVKTETYEILIYDNETQKYTGISREIDFVYSGTPNEIAPNTYEMIFELVSVYDSENLQIESSIMDSEEGDVNFVIDISEEKKAYSKPFSLTAEGVKFEELENFEYLILNNKVYDIEEGLSVGKIITSEGFELPVVYSHMGRGEFTVIQNVNSTIENVGIKEGEVVEEKYLIMDVIDTNGDVVRVVYFCGLEHFSEFDMEVSPDQIMNIHDTGLKFTYDVEVSDIEPVFENFDGSQVVIGENVDENNINEEQQANVM